LAVWATPNVLPARHKHAYHFDNTVIHMMSFFNTLMPVHIIARRFAPDISAAPIRRATSA
jgi:hypothetical protein